jgi:hypothetical protein
MFYNYFRSFYIFTNYFIEDYSIATPKKDTKSRSKFACKLFKSKSKVASQEERPVKKACKSRKKPATDSKPNNLVISS